MGDRNFEFHAQADATRDMPPLPDAPNLSPEESAFANAATAVIKQTSRSVPKAKRDAIGLVLASRIRQARKAFKPLDAPKATQEWLANKLGVTRPAVAQWENQNPQHRTTPSVETLIHLAHVLNVPMSTFIVDLDNDAHRINLEAQRMIFDLKERLLSMDKELSLLLADVVLMRERCKQAAAQQERTS